MIGSEDASHRSNADANEKHGFYSKMIANLANALISKPLFRSYQKITLEGQYFRLLSLSRLGTRNRRLSLR